MPDRHAPCIPREYFFGISFNLKVTIYTQCCQPYCILPLFRGFLVLSSFRHVMRKVDHVLRGRPLSASFFLSSTDVPLKFAPCLRAISQLFGQHFVVSPPASRLSDSFSGSGAEFLNSPVSGAWPSPPPSSVCCQTVFLFVAERERFPIHNRRPPRFCCGKMILLQPAAYAPWLAHPIFLVVTTFLICAGIMTIFGGYTYVSLSLSLICTGV